MLVGPRSMLSRWFTGCGGRHDPEGRLVVNLFTDHDLKAQLVVADLGHRFVDHCAVPALDPVPQDVAGYRNG